MIYQEILQFYQHNGLYQSNHEYGEKFYHLQFFERLDSISIQDIHDYATLRNVQGVKNATINRELTIIRSAINYYNLHHETNYKNPFNGFKLFEEVYLPRYLSNEECKRLLDTCKRYPNPMFYVYIALLLYTGSRSNEILTLTWKCVDLENRCIIIKNSLSKNKKTVYKPLNDKALQVIDDIDYIHYQWVFYNPKTDYHYKTFRGAWVWALKECGLQCRIHDLRHTFASLLVKKGVPLYHVSQLLGHSDTRITQKYAHLSTDTLKDVVDLINI